MDLKNLRWKWRVALGQGESPWSFLGLTSNTLGPSPAPPAVPGALCDWAGTGQGTLHSCVILWMTAPQTAAVTTLLGLYGDD